MTNLYQFFANINLHEFCFVLSILYSSCTVDIIGGWVICCVIGGDHSSGQAICTLAASDSSSIDPVLQNETSCLGACQEEPNCYAYAHNTVDCKFRKTSVPNCLTFLESTAANTAILDVNACSSNPCQYNGVCIDGIGDYTCSCLPGFGGHSCEFSANLALLKMAYESSISGIVTYIASLAVDGIYANFSPTLSCSMTADVSGGPNWLVVDLGLPSVVVQAVLTNRADCCGDRLDNVIVGMTNSFNPGTNPPVRGAYPLCGQYPGKAPNGARLVVNCFSNITPYRYVIVQQPIGGPGFLTVCEVEVYG